MQNEMFKVIQGYESYQISNLGNVKNIKTNRILKPGNSNCGYRFVILNNKNFYIHRLVALAFLENPNDLKFVDHIDNNKNNNRLENLRFCSHAENCRNTKIRNNNTSGFKGISFNKTNQLWYAKIVYNGKHFHLGHYKTIEEAAMARLEKSKILFNDYMNNCEYKILNLNLTLPTNTILNLTITPEKENK